MSRLLSPARNLEEALAHALDALQAGSTMEECLSCYQEYAAELAPLLEAAVMVHRASWPELSPAGRARGRARMHEALERRRRPVSRFRPMWSFAGMTLILLVLAVGVWLAWPGRETPRTTERPTATPSRPAPSVTSAPAVTASPTFAPTPAPPATTAVPPQAPPAGDERTPAPSSPTGTPTITATVTITATPTATATSTPTRTVTPTAHPAPTQPAAPIQATVTPAEREATPRPHEESTPRPHEESTPRPHETKEPEEKETEEPKAPDEHPEPTKTPRPKD
ncbi:MAG: hypothetical protein ACP5UQ_13740 [Anaerolineae bacterium]